MLTAHTKTFQNDRIARRDVIWTSIQNTKGFDIFEHCFHFDAFSTVFDQDGGALHRLIRYVGAFVFIDFQERFQIGAF